MRAEGEFVLRDVVALNVIKINRWRKSFRLEIQLGAQPPIIREFTEGSTYHGHVHVRVES